MADDLPRFPWQDPYLAALTEFDPIKLTLKIGEAEIAIAARLVQQPDGEELEALHDALRNLRFLLNQRDRNTKADVA